MHKMIRLPLKRTNKPQIIYICMENNKSNRIAMERKMKGMPLLTIANNGKTECAIQFNRTASVLS